MPRFDKAQEHYEYQGEEFVPAPEVRMCQGCAFDSDHKFCGLVACMRSEREDGKAVIWIPKEKAPVANIPDADGPARPRVLPDVSATREQYPLFDGLFAYFPAALCEVARWSKAGNDKHNPGEEMHWSRGKSTDHENKILRHLLDARSVNDEGFVEAVGMAWRALALCQTILEERGWAEGQRSRRST